MRGIDHQRQCGDVIEVGVREEDVVNLAHFFQRQIPHASACIDQDVVIDQKRRGSAIAGDGA